VNLLLTALDGAQRAHADHGLRSVRLSTERRLRERNIRAREKHLPVTGGRDRAHMPAKDDPLVDGQLAPTIPDEAGAPMISNPRVYV